MLAGATPLASGIQQFLAFCDVAPRVHCCLTEQQRYSLTFIKDSSTDPNTS